MIKIYRIYDKVSKELLREYHVQPYERIPDEIYERLYSEGIDPDNVDIVEEGEIDPEQEEVNEDEAEQ